MIFNPLLVSLYILVIFIYNFCNILFGLGISVNTYKRGHRVPPQECFGNEEREFGLRQEVAR